MKRALEGLSIVAPESRELDLFASMLEAEGATALRCPLVRICDLEDDGEIEAWIDRLAAGDFQYAIWLTGEGLLRILAVAERTGKRASFVGGLRGLRNVTRGPKPARALRDLGLRPDLAAVPPTSSGVLDALADEEVLGKAIGLQLYPAEGASALLAALGARGARLFPVTPYRYASRAEDESVAAIIREMIAGRVDAIAFTSSPQVDRLLSVARESGLEAQLREALGRIRIAAIGPVVEGALRRRGLEAAVRPAASFHLKSLVRAIVADRSERSSPP